MPFFLLIARFVHSLFRSQRQLILENLALRQQVVMLRQSVKKPRPSVADKLFWIIFTRYVDGWRKILYGLHPDTVVRWHRQGFRLYWRWKSRSQKPGRPTIDAALRKLIREMQAANIGWGRLESMGSCLSWVLISLKQPFQSIWFVRKDHLRRPGGRFSKTMPTV